MEIREQEQLAKWTTFQTGGPSRFFIEVHSEAALAEAVAFARQQALPLFVLGGGSNVLVSDAGFAGVTIRVCIPGVVPAGDEAADEVMVTVGAGEELDAFIEAMVGRGYWGLENLSGIPGTVGAAPIQNVGAYGVEVAERIALVRVFNTKTESFTVLSAADCRFGYRDSHFKHPEGMHYVVTAVTFRLTKTPAPMLGYKELAARFSGTTPTLIEIRDAVLAIRAAKFPNWREVGTAGSFFKNPIITREQYHELLKTYPALPHYEVNTTHVKVPLGWILDKVLSLKGQGSERVGCYEGQALVVHTKAGATTADVLAFTEEIATKVFEATGITIEREVRLVQ